MFYLSVLKLYNYNIIIDLKCSVKIWKLNKFTNENTIIYLLTHVVWIQIQITLNYELGLYKYKNWLDKSEWQVLIIVVGEFNLIYDWELTTIPYKNL